MYKSILIATFSVWENNKRTAINGMIDPLLSFFLPRCKQVDLIDGTHPGSSNVFSRIEQYKEGLLQTTKISFVSIFLSPFLLLQNTSATQLLFKIRDFFVVLEWGIKARKQYDLFIGLESVYTLAGIVLRKLGLVKTVVYYVSDYSPTRFESKLINNVYLFLDRICAENADFIWDVSPAIQQGRILAGLDENKSTTVIHTPNALFSNQIIYKNLSSLIPFSLVFAGTLGLENGPDLAIKAVAKLVKKYPDITLHIFGGNEKGKETALKNLCKELNVENHIIFHGLIHDVNQLSRQISRYMIGLAPYKYKQDSVRAYGDATKLRLYMGVGLPTITTEVPPLGKEIVKKGSALISKDNEYDLAENIEKLFDKDLYLQMRKQALVYGKTNTWENTYKNALRQMSKIK